MHIYAQVMCVRCEQNDSQHSSARVPGHPIAGGATSKTILTLDVMDARQAALVLSISIQEPSVQPVPR